MNFLQKKLLPLTSSSKAIFALWFGIALLATLAELAHGIQVGHSHINNYFIYKHVFWHSVHHQNLFDVYPLDHEDANHYGPFFAIIIAPFAWMNDYVGCFLWCMANVFVLYYAVKKLPIESKKQNIILLIGLLEMITALQNTQFNPMLTGWIILAFTLVKKKQDFWAALFILAGFYTKIYGIVGLVFFFFSENKMKFILGCIFWAVVLFCLPMIISSPHFVVQSYQDWLHSLIEKDAKNIDVTVSNAMQDISVPGMVRRIFNWPNFNALWVMVPALVGISAPLLRFNKIKNINFQLHYLALALISVVIFSSSAESPTYVIAMMGVGLWYVLQNKNNWVDFTLIFAIVLTSLSPTDLIPHFIQNNFVRPYSLKALPCFIVWLWLIFNLIKNNFSEKITDVA